MVSEKIGKVTDLFHYLVKGMKGTSISQSEVGWSGLALDRKFAFIDETNNSGFPWSTGRKQPNMIQYFPKLKDIAGEAKISNIDIHTPNKEIFQLNGEPLKIEISNLFGYPVQLFSQNRGCFDAMPVSLVSKGTLNHLSKQVGLALSPRRFRPNIVVDIDSQLPFDEESWIGKSIRFGDGNNAPIIRFDRKNIRCVMINLDPETSQQNPSVLKEVVASRNKATGIYGTPVRIGEIAIGDNIYID